MDALITVIIQYTDLRTLYSLSNCSLLTRELARPRLTAHYHRLRMRGCLRAIVSRRRKSDSHTKYVKPCMCERCRERGDSCKVERIIMFYTIGPSEDSICWSGGLHFVPFKRAMRRHAQDDVDPIGSQLMALLRQPTAPHSLAREVQMITVRQFSPYGILHLSDILVNSQWVSELYEQQRAMQI
jgi:hypothetical protein